MANIDDLKARKTRRKEELQAEIDRVKAEIAQMKATSVRYRFSSYQLLIYNP